MDTRPATNDKTTARSTQDYEIDISQIMFSTKQLGNGATASVWKGTILGSPHSVAIKQMDMKVVPIACRKERDILVTLTNCNAPNVVRLINYSIKLNPDFHSDYILVMDWANKGALPKWLNVLSLRDKLKIMKDVTTGLGYLHEKEILHCDFKPDNIVINTSEDGKLEAKIIDFGIARIIGEDALYPPKTTPLFMAPELLKFHDHQSMKTISEEDRQAASHSKASEVYSLVLLFNILLTECRFPYAHLQKYYSSSLSTFTIELLDSILTQGKRDPIPECPSELKSIIESGWAANPADRPTAKEILPKITSIYEGIKNQPPLTFFPKPFFYFKTADGNIYPFPKKHFILCQNIQDIKYVLITIFRHSQTPTLFNKDLKPENILCDMLFNGYKIGDQKDFLSASTSKKNPIRLIFNESMENKNEPVVRVQIS